MDLVVPDKSSTSEFKLVYANPYFHFFIEQNKYQKDSLGAGAILSSLNSM